MSDRSAIEWTDATWNPVTGCTKVSPGCDNCYAATFAERWRGVPGHHFTNGFDLTLRPERLNEPFRWRKPRRVFVNSMSDLFHAAVPDTYIARVFAAMALAPQHTFQVLTKRHSRMRSLVSRPLRNLVVDALIDLRDHGNVVFSRQQSHFLNWPARNLPWPLPNVWLGVSVEDQKRADLRIPALLGTPAAIRFLSCEPLLGPIDLSPWLPCPRDPGACGEMPRGCVECAHPSNPPGGNHSPDWVIAGGESGPKARPMHPDWPRGLRDQCGAAQVPFFFKQWGEHVPDPNCSAACEGPHVMRRVGKKAAGRVLDGRTWDEMPTRRAGTGAI